MGTKITIVVDENHPKYGIGYVCGSCENKIFISGKVLDRITHRHPAGHGNQGAAHWRKRQPSGDKEIMANRFETIVKKFNIKINLMDGISIEKGGEISITCLECGQSLNTELVGLH